MYKIDAVSMLRTGNISFNQLFKNGVEIKDTNKWDYWHLLVKTDKLNTKELIEVGIEAKDWEVWIGIVNTGKLNKKELIEVGNIAKDPGVNIAIKNTGKVNDEELTKLVTRRYL